MMSQFIALEIHQTWLMDLNIGFVLNDSLANSSTSKDTGSEEAY